MPGYIFFSIIYIEVQTERRSEWSFRVIFGRRVISGLTGSGNRNLLKEINSVIELDLQKLANLNIKVYVSVSSLFKCWIQRKVSASRHKFCYIKSGKDLLLDVLKLCSLLLGRNLDGKCR